jgi:indolepyruvate ferredoxin oxidoreductase beta subunit
MTFNVFIGGVGGLGLLTLTRIIADAALAEGNEVKTLEFHGLAQRYGTLQCQIRFGKERIYSSMIPPRKADLLVGLEPIEAMRGMYYTDSRHTTTIVNTRRIFPLALAMERKEYPSMKWILGILGKISKSVLPVDASGAVEKEGHDIMMSNTYLLGTMSKQGLLPLKRTSLLRSMDSTLPEPFRKVNRKIFEAGEKHRF